MKNIFKSESKMVSVNLKNIVAIPNYTPDGDEHMYVIGVDGKLETDRVVGFPDTKPIRSLVCTAVPESPEDRDILGDRVILADKKFVSMAKSRLHRKEALAMIHMLNVTNGCTPEVSLTSNLSDNVTSNYTKRHASRLDAARLYGFKPMKKAMTKQNAMILNSMKSSACALRKSDKKAQKESKKATAAQTEEVVAEIICEATKAAIAEATC